MQMFTIAAHLLTAHEVDGRTSYEFDENSTAVVEPVTRPFNDENEARNHLISLIEAADQPTSITDPRLRVFIHEGKRYTTFDGLFS